MGQTSCVNFVCNGVLASRAYWRAFVHSSGWCESASAVRCGRCRQ